MLVWLVSLAVPTAFVLYCFVESIKKYHSKKGK